MNSRNVKFALWVTYCKTSTCRCCHVAKVIGEYEGRAEYLLPAELPEWFDFRCPACGDTHRYTHHDLAVRIQQFLPAFQVEWW